MSRSWDGADSLVGMVGSINLNGKAGGIVGSGPAGFYLPASSATMYGGGGITHAGHCAQPVMELADGSSGYVPSTVPSFMGQPTTNGYHPAVAANMQQHYSASRAQMMGVHCNLHMQPPDLSLAAPHFMHIPGAMDGYLMPSLGWGGQAIQDAAGFKAPWFGKTRGGGRGGNNAGAPGGNAQQRNNTNNTNNRGATNSRGRNNGGNNTQNGGRGGNSRGGANNNRSSWNEALDETPPEEVVIEKLVSVISTIPAGQHLNDSIYQSLFQLQGRSCALVLKELARGGLHRRAAELFDWIRVLDPGHPLHSLLDVYSYTAAISLCIATHDVERAMALAAEMKTGGVLRNVHTYTALMNVCIKCSKYELALHTYESMRGDRCPPNVVTYNTLIDVYGKTGRWEEAVAVLGTMKGEGVEPVLRTYNTLLIACNMCSQPREAMAIYRRMLNEGFAPNSTTYNALISAYGKAGQLDRVMELFQEMVYRGCERNVITYSSLISACEKAGRWELALELFQEMIRERCNPNTVTFNSLITALGQGSQWEKAEEVFQEMQVQGCTPDVVTYTALISSLEKGGQWRRALAAFDRMHRQGCRADSIVYNAIIDTLWETGVIWAQRRALGLFRTAIAEGHFGQSRLVPGMARAEVNLHAMTAGVAMLCLYAWLMSLKSVVAAAGVSALPLKVAIVTDRGRGAKEQGNLVVKEAVAALMHRWGAPFRPIVGDLGGSGTLEAVGADVAAWLLSDAFEQQLFAFFPCTDILPSVANMGQSPGALAAVGALLDDAGFQREAAVEQCCTEAFSAVRLFEKTHCLALQNMGFAYLQRRSQLVARCADVAAALGVKPEAGHDAVLLMDRVMSTSLALAPDLLDLLSASCVIIAAKQVDGPAAALTLPAGIDLHVATGMPATAVEQMEWNVRQVLGQDTAAISTLRCLKLYLERLGGHVMDKECASAMAGRAFFLVDCCLADMAFLNCRPSVIAAAVLYTDRRARGVIPFWPTMLAKVTGYQDMSTPELAVAIKAAQRIAGRSVLNGGGGGGGGGSNSCSSARSTSNSSGSPTSSTSPRLTTATVAGMDAAAAAVAAAQGRGRGGGGSSSMSMSMAPRTSSSGSGGSGGSGNSNNSTLRVNNTNSTQAFANGTALMMHLNGISASRTTTTLHHHQKDALLLALDRTNVGALSSAYTKSNNGVITPSGTTPNMAPGTADSSNGSRYDQNSSGDGNSVDSRDGAQTTDLDGSEEAPYDVTVTV